MAVAPETSKINSSETKTDGVSENVEYVDKKENLATETKDLSQEARANAERLGDAIQRAAALGVVTAPPTDPAQQSDVLVTSAQVNKLYAEITGVTIEEAEKLSTAKKLELLVSDPKSASRPKVLNEEVDLLVQQSHEHEGDVLS